MAKDDRAEQTPDEYPDTLIGFLNLLKCTTCGNKRVELEEKGWICLMCDDGEGGEGGT